MEAERDRIEAIREGSAARDTRQAIEDLYFGALHFHSCLPPSSEHQDHDHLGRLERALVDAIAGLRFFEEKLAAAEVRAGGST